MQIRLFRGSGEPAWVNAPLPSARVCLGPDPRRALGPAAIPAAKTGRTRDRTRPMLQNVRKFLPGRRPHVTHMRHLSTVTDCVRRPIKWPDQPFDRGLGCARRQQLSELHLCLAGSPENLEYSRQFGSHLGNPGQLARNLGIENMNFWHSLEHTCCVGFAAMGMLLFTVPASSSTMAAPAPLIGVTGPYGIAAAAVVYGGFLVYRKLKNRS